MRMDALSGLILTWVSIIGVGAQQPAITLDDRDVLETVFEQIQSRAGSPALDKGRPDSLPIKVVDQARPICRAKLTDFEMAWPLLCAENPLRVLKKSSNDALPGWLQAAGLDHDERLELVHSFEDRNVDWRALPGLRNKYVESISRQRYFDLTQLPRGLVVFSLPGYSRIGRAVVHATFSCGMLCGTAYVVVLQRSAHGWTISQVVPSEIT